MTQHCDHPEAPPGEEALRVLVPEVLQVLIRRGANFADAEDAVQEALVSALSSWPEKPPRDPKGWLVTVAWRKFLDLSRANISRRRREEQLSNEPPPGPATGADDTLELYFLCAHPALSPASAVALTLRAVGGLTTRQIAAAYLVPEATMAQRISRAKRTIADVQPLSMAASSGAGDPESAVSGVAASQRGTADQRLATVLTTLYLVFNEGYSGAIDLASESIRLTRQLATATDDPEVAGLLSLMLLHHARRPARTHPDGSLVPLAEQDRSVWQTDLMMEGIDRLQATLARDRLGPYQAQAAIAALHADAQQTTETDWVQIVEWYDELLAFGDNPVVRLNRAVAIGEADGAPAGLAALAAVPNSVPRRTATAAYLQEKGGNLTLAAQLYAEAARESSNVLERNHLTKQAARLNQHAT